MRIDKQQTLDILIKGLEANLGREIDRDLPASALMEAVDLLTVGEQGQSLLIHLGRVTLVSEVLSRAQSGCDTE